MQSAAHATQADHCAKKPRPGKGGVSLPVLPSKPAKPHSRMGRWRAAVLTLVHILIIVHVVLWLMSGDPGSRSTLSPVEPSEAMFTLEQGKVNAGFVLFAGAIVLTALLGRYFCGWACHVVALQDLCAWMMKKIGVHPKPWRSRLLVWMPLLIALYMFVWPTFRREVLALAIGEQVMIAGQAHYVLTARQAAWLGDVQPLHGFEAHFQVEDFWATFPPWYVAIPFLLVCGFATVYFMGAKGFCTYGCPYGGFFGPADRLAPVRIRVTDACEHCGHCTAVCTSNVRVHEEVRDYGMVVDPGCMKCMDCVSACPNDALYVGLGRPALLAKVRSEPAVYADAQAKRAARFDLTWAQELALLVAFIVMLNGYRGIYGMTVPLLMATGAAAVVTYFIHTTWQMLRPARPSVRAPFWQLKLNGRIRPAGWAFAALTTALTFVGLHGACLRVCEWWGDGYDRLVQVARATVMKPGYTPAPDDVRRAKEAIGWYGLLQGVSDGGLAPVTRAPVAARLSWLHAVAGDLESSERHLRRAIERHGANGDLLLDLAAMRLLRAGTLDDVRALLVEAKASSPEMPPPGGATVITFLGAAIIGASRAEPDAAMRVVADVWPQSPAPHEGVALPLASEIDRAGGGAAGEGRARALAYVRTLIERWPRLEAARKVLAMDLFRQGKAEEALALYQRAVAQFPTDVDVVHNAVELMLATNNIAMADGVLAPALKANERAPVLWDDHATVLFFMGRDAEAARALRRAIALEPTADRWSRLADLFSPGRLNLPEEMAKAQAEASRLSAPAPGASTPPQ